MDCPNIKQNKKVCTCVYESCVRHGRCCECIAYHRSKGNLPSCLNK